jgi:hypothetical protein
MTYRLTGEWLFYSCWELLDQDEKVEARATMREEALTMKEKGADVSKTEVTERAAKMGLGPNGRLMYTFGHGNLYDPIWHLLSSEGTRRGPIADAGNLLYNT